MPKSGVQRRVKQDFDYAFSENPYPGVPEIRLHTILPDAPFRIGDAEIVPIRGIHYKLPFSDSGSAGSPT